MLKALSYPFNLLRKRLLAARLAQLEYSAVALQAQMIVDPIHLARYRIQMTDTRLEIERLERRSA